MGSLPGESPLFCVCPAGTPTSAWAPEMRVPCALQGQVSEGRGDAETNQAPCTGRKIAGPGKAPQNRSALQQPHLSSLESGEHQGPHKDSTEGPASSPALPSSLGGPWCPSSSKASHVPSCPLWTPNGPRTGTGGWEPRVPTLPLSVSVNQACYLPPSRPVVLTFQRGSLSQKCSPKYAPQHEWRPGAQSEAQ